MPVGSAGPEFRFIKSQLLPLIRGKAAGTTRLPYFVAPRSEATELANQLSADDTPIFGSDSRDGLSPSDALLTLQEAINRCQNDVGDRIICMRGTHSVTSPVLFNKRGIIVQTMDTGFNPYSRGERFNIDCATDVAAKISQPCIIEGLGFQGGAATKASVQLANGSGFASNWVYLYRCRFTNWNNAKYAISGGQDGAGNDYCAFEECDFDGTINGVTGGANTFDSGIYFVQGHYMKVLNCIFRGCTYAITHAGQAPNSAPEHWNQEFDYHGNRVLDELKFLDAGDIGVMTTQKGLISNNYFSTATDAATYSDTVANLQAIHMQFAGNHYKGT